LKRPSTFTPPLPLPSQAVPMNTLRLRPRMRTFLENGRRAYGAGGDGVL
jgi:hypothetical protein